MTRDAETTFDLIVLGAGNALALAIRAAKAGRRVAVIERGLLGGTCPNVGCIPTKLLLAHADVARTIRDAGRFHIDAELRSIDGAAILREVFEATTGSVDGKIAGNLPDDLTLLRGTGRFVGERTLEVEADDGTTNRVRGEAVVIATGARSRRPSGLDGVPYWTSDDVFHLRTLPESIAIVGGGFIGAELAYFFHAMGVSTTLVARDEQLLTAADEDARRVFTEGFSARVPTRLSCAVEGVTHDGARFHVTTSTGEPLVVERLLYAIGRVPNADRIGADAGGIELDESGAIRTDDRLRTSAEGVYALGDVTGGPQFTHAASFAAAYLGDVLLEGHDAPLDYGPMPAATFSAPEIASVGRTEQELREADIAYVSVSRPYTTAAKGRAIKEPHGLCKLLVAPDGEILGCHIVGDHASILVHEVIPVMKWRNHVRSLTDIIHIHPSLPEVLRNTARAARDALDR